MQHGNFYAATAVAKIVRSTDGVVRAGLAIYSTLEEAQRLIAAVARL